MNFDDLRSVRFRTECSADAFAVRQSNDILSQNKLFDSVRQRLSRRKSIHDKPSRTVGYGHNFIASFHFRDIEMTVDILVAEIPVIKQIKFDFSFS